MQPFNVGTAFGETIRISFRNIPVFGPVALAAAGILMATETVLGPQWVHFDFEAGLTTTGFGTFLTFLGVFMLVVIALVAVTTYGAFQDMQGRKVGLVESLTGGIGNVRLAIGPGALAAVAFVGLSVPLVIPGCLALVVLFVVVPVAAIERLGVWASLRRSFDLTLGHWWDIFWLSFFIGFVGGAVGIGARIVTPVMEPVSAFVLDLILNSLCFVFLAVTPTVAYVHLYRAQEDAGPAELQSSGKTA